MIFDFRKCDECKGEFRPRRRDQSYCSPRCRRDASYTRERLLKKGPKSFRKTRLATPLPGSFRNGPFSQTNSVSSRAAVSPDIGAFVREQVVARAHLENPITIFLPDGSQGRVWLGGVIGDELHWRLNVKAAIGVDQDRLRFRGASSYRRL
jgi:hypothetical protein